MVGVVERLGGVLDEVEAVVGAGGVEGVGVLAWLGVMRRVEGLSVLVGVGARSWGGWSGEGFGSVGAWVGARSNAGRGVVGRLVGRSGVVGVCPLLVGAWVAGRVEFEHVRVVVEAHRRFPRLVGALRAAEPDIVRAACEVDPVVLDRELFGLLHRLDPGAVDEAVEARRRGEVGLRVSRLLDGYVRVDGLLPPEVGQALLSVLHAARAVVRAGGVTPGPDAGPDKGAGSGGGAVPDAGPDASVDGGVGVGRVGVRLRNVAALAHVLQVVAGVPGGLPVVAGSRPVLQVQVPVESLVSGRVPGWVVGVSGGRVVPVSASSVQRLACDGVRRLLVVDESGMVDAVSAASRVVPSRLNMVVRVRDDGVCRFPGCTDPIREVHHVVPWSRGGVTVSSNLVGVCWHHHHLVHEGGWTVRGDANVSVRFTSPGGRSVTSPVPSRAGLLHTPHRC